MSLQELEEFKTDEQFSKVRQFLYELVSDGTLRACDIDPADQWHFVEIFKSMDGEEWHLAIPDHSFRGYLKKIR